MKEVGPPGHGVLFKKRKENPEEFAAGTILLLQDADTTMAEEAGLSMPPPSP